AENIRVQRRHLANKACIGIGFRIGRIKPVNVAQQDEAVSGDHLRNAGGEPVVIAIADFAGGDGIILIDHRESAEREQRAHGAAGVEVAATLLGIAGGEQDLRDADVMDRKDLLIGVRELDLADGGGRLAFLQPERPAFETEHMATHGDGPARDDQHFLAARAHFRDILGKRAQPCMAKPARAAVNEQRRADFDDDPFCAGKSVDQGRHVSASAPDCFLCSSSSAARSSALPLSTYFKRSKRRGWTFSPMTAEITCTRRPVTFCSEPTFSASSSSLTESILLSTTTSGFAARSAS